MGWEIRRFSVPSDRSLLMASKPSVRPTNGPSSAIDVVNDGIVLPLNVNSFRKI